MFVLILHKFHTDNYHSYNIPEINIERIILIVKNTDSIKLNRSASEYLFAISGRFYFHAVGFIAR